MLRDNGVQDTESGRCFTRTEGKVQEVLVDILSVSVLAATLLGACFIGSGHSQVEARPGKKQ